MTYKRSCDMRGMLSFNILWLLSRKQMHGEEIALELKKRRGEKPKPGTLYPALKELKRKGLITCKKSGKIIVYSLTPEGKKDLKYGIQYFRKAFGDIINNKT
jgi:PadR family transcriptional regulator, regulatory protein PadR